MSISDFAGSASRAQQIYISVLEEARRIRRVNEMSVTSRPNSQSQPSEEGEQTTNQALFTFKKTSL